MGSHGPVASGLIRGRSDQVRARQAYDCQPAGPAERPTSSTVLGFVHDEEVGHRVRERGHVEGLDEEPSPAYFKLDEPGATVTVPLAGSLGDLWIGFHEDSSKKVPPFLWYADTNRAYVLGDCGPSGGSVSSLGDGFFRSARVA